MRTLDADAADKVKVWADVSRELNQWDVVETFAERHGQALKTRAGF